MNLFESSIERLKTRDNSAYLEAVSKLYGILFESVFENPFPNAAAQIQANPRNALHRFVHQAVEAIKALNQTSKFFGGLVNRQFSSLLFTLDKDTTSASDQTLYDWTATAMKGLREGTHTEDEDTFDSYNVSLSERKAYLTYKNFVEKFCDEVLPKFQELAPDFVDYGGKKKKPKTVSLGKDFFKDQTGAGASDGASGEAEPEVVPADTDASAPVKKKGSKKSSKDDEADNSKEEESYERFAQYIDGNVDGYCDDPKTENFIVMHDVTNAESVISRMQTGLDAVVKNKAGSGTSPFNASAITFEARPETNDVCIFYDPSWANGSSDPVRVNTVNNVLLYCLYLDAKKRGMVNSADISSSVTKSIIFDMRPRAQNPNKKDVLQGGGYSALRRLIGQKNADVMTSIGTLSNDILVEQMPGDEIDNKVKYQLANAIKAYIAGMNKAELEEQINSEDKQGFRESFTDGVINIFANQFRNIEDSLTSSADDPIASEEEEGLTQSDVDQFRQYLDTADENGQTMFDKVIADMTSSGMTTVNVGGRQVLKADERITPDTYNGQASTVIDINIAAQSTEASSYSRYSKKTEPSQGLSAEELAARYDFDSADTPEAGGLIKTKKVRR